MAITSPIFTSSNIKNNIAFAQGVYAVKPSNFKTNTEALLDNKFMRQDVDQDGESFNAQIQREHETFVKNIQDAGIQITVFPQMGKDAPDSVFPDWFTCYKGEAIPEGVLILHPMKYQSRRNERQPEIIKQLSQSYKHIIDLTHFENEGKALEGKGSVVFNHRSRCFYIAISNRAHIEVVEEFVSKWNKICINGKSDPYKAVTFEAIDQHGEIIYHTDCMLVLLGKHALVCLDAIQNQTEKQKVIKSITESQHPLGIIELTLQQIEFMSANAQTVTNSQGEFCVIQSHRGYSAMTEQQKLILNEHYRMVITQVDLIESVGGGSCRCMLVENWSTITSQMISDSNGFTKAERKLTSNSFIGDKYFTDIKSQNSQEKTNTNSNYSNNGEEIQNYESNQITEFYVIKRINSESFFFKYEEDDQSQLKVYDIFNLDYLDEQRELPNYWDKQFSNPFEDLIALLDDKLSLKQDQVKIKLHKKFQKFTKKNLELELLANSLGCMNECSSAVQKSNEVFNRLNVRQRAESDTLDFFVCDDDAYFENKKSVDDLNTNIDFFESQSQKNMCYSAEAQVEI